ncbi:MAG: 5'-nucleotidase, lipoprotein e(P4) family [Acidobacteriota bacterium]|nr:5'-nucleotidase, lipoprotein e(P4) family [Acidobacteriota bacterium]
MKTRKYLLSFGLVLASVVSTYFATTSVAQQGAQTQPSAADNEYQVGAILFMQKAAEYRALAYQAFNVARMQLDADEKDRKKLPKAERRKQRAVVVDVDETVLDNSPAQAVQVKRRLPFIQENWTAWVNMRKAKAIPGAIDFLNYASREGARIFYVTNRIEVEKQPTIDNLKALGFPDVSAETVIVRQTESSKEARRQAILQKYRIAVLIGDNLDDLSNVFERKTVDARFAEVDRARELFGRRFIVLPNAMYGTWEGAIYEYGRLTEAQKAEKRANALETY